MTTTIQKWGNSQGVRIPKYILEDIKWHDNEQLNITTENEKIVIEKVKIPARRNIKELFADFDGQYTPVKVDWGNPVGNEIW